MCNLYSITTNQAAIIALFRVLNRYVGNLPPMPGVFQAADGEGRSALPEVYRSQEERVAATLAETHLLLAGTQPALLAVYFAVPFPVGVHIVVGPPFSELRSARASGQLASSFQSCLRNFQSSSIASFVGMQFDPPYRNMVAGLECRFKLILPVKSRETKKPLALSRRLRTLNRHVERGVQSRSQRPALGERKLARARLTNASERPPCMSHENANTQKNQPTCQTRIHHHYLSSSSLY